MKTGEISNGDPTSLENPYVGPRPFRQDEQGRFFGRNEEISILEGLVLARRATLLFAQSGAGKSSLLQAGLIPSLTRERTVGYGRRQRTYQQMRVLRILSVGGAIPPNVKQEDVRNVYVFSALLTLHSDESSWLHSQEPDQLAGLSLAEGLAGELSPPQLDQMDIEGERPPDTLVVFDQFEELFTRHTERWHEREAFFKQVREALDQHPSLRVFFSMREDYIAELTPYTGLLTDQLRSQFRLERLREPAALEAIRRPAESARRSFEPGAAELLVALLRTNQTMPPNPTDISSTPSSLTEFVEPVQLQVVCRRLWANMPARRRIIRREDVEKFADVHLALTEFYEEAVTTAVQEMRSSETPISELRLRTWFDKQLITPTRRTRSLVYRDTDTTGGMPNAVVDILDYQAHIIRPMIRGKDTWYELVHDRLVFPISQSNQAWRSLHAADWQLLAEQWRQDQPRSLLLGEEALAKADHWLAEQQYTPEPHEQRFLEKSRETLEQARKQLVQQEKKRTNLAETGWGVIFAHDDPHVEEIKAALQELLELRQQQAGARYQVLAGPKGYRSGTAHQPGESGQQFLTRFGVGPGVTNYDRLPYYLLIVGDPERIPFEFQYALQTQHAVGRLYFQTPAEYSRYARSVVQAENGSFSLPPTVALFGPQDPANSATTQALDRLFSPLLSTLLSAQQDRDWEIEDVLESDATKSRLLNLLGGPETPALLFSGSYGASTSSGDFEQQEIQGAIMCQVVPTPQEGVKPRSPQDYLAAGDIGEEAHLLGSIAFLFGGWSAGTPHLDSFPSNGKGQKELAPNAFIARLPQRLLSHPKGGMLAVIGHVDQAWTASFSWQGVELAINHFSGTLRRLMEGYSVGAAAEPITQRYHQLSSMLAEELQQVFFYDGKRNNSELAQLNLYTIDTRNFIILGDPAVRLPLENGPVALERPTIEPVDSQEAFSFLESISEAGTPEKLITKGLEGRDAEATTSTALLYFNGINGATGDYWTPPMRAEELTELINQERSPENLQELRFRARSRGQKRL